MCRARGCDCGYAATRLGEIAEQCVGGLLLALDVAERLFDARQAGLQLIDRVIEGLDLGGDGILLVLRAELQAVDVDGHLVDGVRCLLYKILEYTHALVIGLLETCDSVLQLLNLRLELDEVPVLGVGRETGESSKEKRRCGEAK